jgi:16S rRNA (cytosine1402-N4)-methyltransferase
MNEFHTPVLLQASVDGLNIRPGGIYVDATFGGGGHSREILRRLEGGKLFGFDQDIAALANVPDDPRFVFVHSNFRFLGNFLHYHQVEQVDGILADLGVSSHHFDEEERGFSFRFEDQSLDMRMNRGSSRTAADILNKYKEEDLAALFSRYGELPGAFRLAKAIVNARQIKRFDTVSSLLQVVEPLFRRESYKKDEARLFQALRMEVNHEMDALERLLLQSLQYLKPKGRLVVISYHSLEDRLVKHFMKTGHPDGLQEKDFYGQVRTPFLLINSKVITPDEREQVLNPRSRSAKLRIAEKKESW